MYIVIEIQNGAVGKNVWTYATRDEAFSKYHAVLSVAAVSEVGVHAAVILDDHGQQIAAQAFTHEVPKPEE